MEHAQELARFEHVVGAHAASSAGIGDAAVELAGRLEGLLHRPLDVGLLGHVGDDGVYAAAVARGLGDALGRVLQLRLRATADRDGRAVGREPGGAASADAGAAARDENGEAFEAARGCRRHDLLPRW
jgi:hypothetical protein